MYEMAFDFQSEALSVGLATAIVGFIAGFTSSTQTTTTGRVGWALTLAVFGFLFMSGLVWYTNQ
jgi:hypothetical protein